MKITVLVENLKTKQDLAYMHGLSLYIETKKHKILADLGDSDLFLRNAEKLKINIDAIDTVILTHGHSDHGGGLKTFLEYNNHASVYVKRTAFRTHYKKEMGLYKDMGLNPELQKHPQVILLDDNYIIDSELRVVTNPKGRLLLPKRNESLYEEVDGEIVHDEFVHEQSLIITENKNVLIGGCAHRGIVNIIDNAAEVMNKKPDYVISGLHLYNTAFNNSEESINKLADMLLSYNIKYYTCHCTGLETYELLKRRMKNNIDYLYLGKTIDIN